MFEHCDEEGRRLIAQELHPYMPMLITDTFGNYVVQCLIEKGGDDDRCIIRSIIIPHLHAYLQHKLAQHVARRIWTKAVFQGKPVSPECHFQDDC